MLTVGTFNAGTVNNVIPQSAVLAGTVRTLSEGVRAEVEEIFRRMTGEICSAAGAKASIQYDRCYPVLVSDDGLTKLVEEAAGGCPGVTVLRLPRPFMGSEDFSYYGRICPTAYFFLGAGNADKGFTYPNHNPCFDFDEEALPIGVQIFLATLEALWDKKAAKA